MQKLAHIVENEKDLALLRRGRRQRSDATQARTTLSEGGGSSLGQQGGRRTGSTKSGACKYHFDRSLRWDGLGGGEDKH